jgi:gas vesicle protein
MNNNNGKLLLAVLAGGAVGFALGMLLAPSKGSDLRQNILGSLDDVGNRVSRAVSEGREKLMDLTGMGGAVDETENGVASANTANNLRGRTGMNPSKQAVS